MIVQRKLAARLLASVADELETMFNAHRCCNTLLARFAGDATILLGFDELTRRYSLLLKRSKWRGFFGGIITNARLPSFVPKRLRQLTPLDKIETEHPVFPNEYAAEVFRKCYPEMLPCIDDGFDSLLSTASTEFVIEEVALSQAILGLHDDALVTTQWLTERNRKNHVRFVIAIEEYRRDRIDEAQAVQAKFEDGTLAGWGGAQFALGICNRVPWSLYPYPDC